MTDSNNDTNNKNGTNGKLNVLASQPDGQGYTGDKSHHPRGMHLHRTSIDGNSHPIYSKIGNSRLTTYRMSEGHDEYISFKSNPNSQKKLKKEKDYLDQTIDDMQKVAQFAIKEFQNKSVLTQPEEDYSLETNKKKFIRDIVDDLSRTENLSQISNLYKRCEGYKTGLSDIGSVPNDIRAIINPLRISIDRFTLAYETYRAFVLKTHQNGLGTFTHRNGHNHHGAINDSTPTGRNGR